MITEMPGKKNCRAENLDYKQFNHQGQGFITIGSQMQLPAVATQSNPSKLQPILCCACTLFSIPEKETDAAAIPSIIITVFTDFFMSEIVF
jgi:hypothetical protein